MEKLKNHSVILLIILLCLVAIAGCSNDPNNLETMRSERMIISIINRDDAMRQVAINHPNQK